MINRLISNLPYNPSLINELAFYTKRIKREESIRKVGFVLIILSLFVQMFAASFPAEKSLAQSPNNDLIGRVETKAQILRAWDNPRTGVAQAYQKFGVTRKDISNLSNKPNDTIKSYARNNYWSVGKQPLSSHGKSGPEVALNINGPIKKVYMRPLHVWDSGSHSSYRAFKGKNSTTGKAFWILVDCGNYTQVGKFAPAKPELGVKKSIKGDLHRLKAGDDFVYRIQYRNKVPDSVAEDVVITDNLDLNNFDVISPNNLNISRNGKLTVKVGDLKYSEKAHLFGFRVKLKSNLKTGTTTCNAVRLSSANAKDVTNGGGPATCVKIFNPCPYNGNIGKENPACKPNTPPPAVITPEETPVPPPPPEQPDTPVSLSKTVKNITQNLEGDQAIASKINAGDVLEYQLITTNSDKTKKEQQEISDDIGDLLDYADIDTAFLAAQAGSFDANAKTISWTNQTLEPSADTIKTFRIVMKNPLPSTNQPSTVSNDFDCKIANAYGNEISMDVQCPVLKTVETLPNTGPGTAIGIAFAATSISGYFFARSRLLAKELLILRRSYHRSRE